MPNHTKFPPSPEEWAALSSAQQHELVAIQTEGFITFSQTLFILKRRLYADWPNFPSQYRQSKVKWMQFACFCFSALTITVMIWSAFGILKLSNNNHITIHLVLKAILQQFVFFVALYIVLNVISYAFRREFTGILHTLYLGILHAVFMEVSGLKFPKGMVVTGSVTLLVSFAVDAYRLAKAAMWFRRLNQILDEVITSPVGQV